MFGFLREAVTKAVASTSLGQTMVIKPKILGYITKIRVELDSLKIKFETAKLFQESSELKLLIEDVFKKSYSLIDDIEHKDTIDPIVTIVSKLLNKYPSKESFKARLKQSASATKLTNFLLSLIHLKQYQSLIEQVKSIEDIHALKGEEQRLLYQSLSDVTLTQTMHDDLSQIDIDKVKAKTKKHVDPMCDHLELSMEDKAILMGIFDRLSDKHLPLLKEAQTALVQHMPIFLASAKEYIVKEYPHLAIEDSAPIVTPQLTQAIAKNEEVVPDIEIVETIEETVDLTEKQKLAHS